MLHFRSCPKCTKGTVEHNNDPHGGYLQCINCGFMRDVADSTSKEDAESMLSKWRKELKTPDSGSATSVA